MRLFVILASAWLAVLLLTAAAGLGNYSIYHDWLCAAAVALAVCGAGIIAVIAGLMMHWDMSKE